MAKKYVIVGAGPVGALAGLYAATRGHEVEIYDLREDLRHADTTPLNFTKSINLALSERGIHGLRSSGHEGLLDKVVTQTIPMYGRMIHTKSPIGGLSEQSQAYDVHGRFLRSVDRGMLNATLLDELEKLPNVKLFFRHKLTGADFRQRRAWFEVRGQDFSENAKQRPAEIHVDFDLMLGCDGAHSAVRYHMMKFARTNYLQEYIDCLWSEFSMTPSTSGDFKISPNHLHIWPAGDCMFIALPNLDKSFVCTLFGPTSLFSRLEASNEAELVRHFDQLFPGLSSLISSNDLYNQFKRNPHLPLINIKCSPHHFDGSVAILGDAANAMVPFYGQGMNAGLESVRVLFEHLDRHPNDTDKALSSYTSYRTSDAHAIADLALSNYTEMRSSVTDPLYKLRKFIEERLDRYLPSLGWSTQYAKVSFSNMRYSMVVERSRRQKEVLRTIVASAGLLTASSIMYYVFKNLSRKR